MQSFINVSIRDLRDLAVNFGIDPTGLDRVALGLKVQAAQEAVEVLRQECAAKGLDTDGSLADLKLRLAQADPGSLQPGDRRLYRQVAVSFVVLGLAALAVSLPHVAGEISRLTGLGWLPALAFALVIDAGIIAAKVTDVLANKFDLGSVRLVNRLALVGCLVLSAAVNWSGFAQAGTSVALSGVFACFVSLFVYGSFQLAGFMLLNANPRQESQAEASPSQKLRQAAADFDRLTKLASSL